MPVISGHPENALVVCFIPWTGCHLRGHSCRHAEISRTKSAACCPASLDASHFPTLSTKLCLILWTLKLYTWTNRKNKSGGCHAFLFDRRLHAPGN
jgi:hypothetical protein